MPPHIFIGVALLDGQPASPGTIVSAYIGGTEVSTSEVGDDGKFRALQVGIPGQTVTFRVGDFEANETATTETGGADIVTLNASSN